MKKNILIIGSLIVMSSCSRYSRVMEDAKKEDMKENERVYGEVGGEARQTKDTYTASADAADKSAKIHDVMFGKGKPVQTTEAQPDTTTSKVDTAAAKAVPAK